MYLVSPEYLNTTVGKNTQPPTTPQAMKEKRLEKPRAVKKKNMKAKKDTGTHAYDKWVKVRSRLHEANVELNRLIHTIADFLKKVLPFSKFDQKVKPKLDALHSGTQTELSPPPNLPNVTFFFLRRPNERPVLNRTFFRPPLVTSCRLHRPYRNRRRR